MFTRLSFTAFLALPLLSNAGVIPVLPPVPSSDDSISTGLTGRQVITASPHIGPVLPIDTDSTVISSRQVITASPNIGPVLPIDTDSTVISSRQVTTLSPVLSSVLPLVESKDAAVITGAVSPVVGPVLPIVSSITSSTQDITGSVAISSVLPRGGDGATCTTGTAQCCDSTESASALSPAVATLLGLLGVVVSDIAANVGVTCSPISVIGVGGNSCSSQTVCCENNHFNGLVSLGCTPLDVGL
ncbi:fungal hydrophobin-domain-containing protein [Desarmillaria tabescens]|uniref:Hydrophobin n=1 Tax=Armillaria tabescens TaxID=1929756 RepID=A0AA39JIE7_ARMTA|nr:fungal hydrophobin-domain-containing protein [Desarmillaria tabescens]KAK0443346.1 fungal hydrophobin-domain-containing protein [Desarmillaria tabescens]